MVEFNGQPRRVSMRYILGISNNPFKDPNPPPSQCPPQHSNLEQLLSTPGGIVEWAASDGRKGTLTGPGKIRSSKAQSGKTSSEKNERQNKNAKKKPVVDGTNEADVNNPHGFTNEEDKKLLLWKNANPNAAWKGFAEGIGKEVWHCKERFKQLNSTASEGDTGKEQSGADAGKVEDNQKPQKQMTKKEKKAAKKEKKAAKKEKKAAKKENQSQDQDHGKKNGRGKDADVSGGVDNDVFGGGLDFGGDDDDKANSKNNEFSGANDNTGGNDWGGGTDNAWGSGDNSGGNAQGSGGNQGWNNDTGGGGGEGGGEDWACGNGNTWGGGGNSGGNAQGSGDDKGWNNDTGGGGGEGRGGDWVAGGDGNGEGDAGWGAADSQNTQDNTNNNGTAQQAWGVDNNNTTPVNLTSKHGGSKVPTHRPSSHKSRSKNHDHNSSNDKNNNNNDITAHRLEIEIKPDSTFSADDLRLIAKILQQDYAQLWQRVSFRFGDRTGRRAMPPEVFEKKITGRVEREEKEKERERDREDRRK